MENILYANHLKLGSASSYRQAGLAKYLGRLGFGADFIGRGSAVKLQGSAGAVPEEWSHFRRFWFWREPLVNNFLSNLRTYREACAEAALVHMNRANPFTATISSLERSGRRRLVVDMEDWDGFGGYSTYSRLYGPKGALLTLYENSYPRTADLVLVVSHLLYARMHQLGVPEDKLLIIPNGYDEDLFRPTVSKKTVRDLYGLGDAPVLIYMSTYHTFEKQLHLTALAAFERVVRRLPEARLLMVGGGNLPIRPIIEEQGLVGKVIPTGFVPRDQLPSLMAAADLALHVISDHPFHSASSPMVMSEYMAMGKAIVAPSVGELRYALGDGTGLLVDRVDPELLAEGVLRVLRDDSLRKDMGAAAIQKARSEYSYAVLAERLKAAYSRFLR